MQDIPVKYIKKSWYVNEGVMSDPCVEHYYLIVLLVS